MLGLSVVMQSGAIAFEVVRWAGVAHLLFMGISMIRDGGQLQLDDALSRDSKSEASQSEASQVVSSESMARVVWRGVVLNLLNPKLTIFLFAFLPLVPQQCSQPPRSTTSDVGTHLHADDSNRVCWLCHLERCTARQGIGTPPCCPLDPNDHSEAYSSVSPPAWPSPTVNQLDLGFFGPASGSRVGTCQSSFRSKPSFFIVRPSESRLSTTLQRALPRSGRPLSTIRPGRAGLMA